MRDFLWAEEYISIATAYATRRPPKVDGSGDRVRMQLSPDKQLMLFQEYDQDQVVHHFVQLLSADGTVSASEEIHSHLELQLYLCDHVKDET